MLLLVKLTNPNLFLCGKCIHLYHTMYNIVTTEGNCYNRTNNFQGNRSIKAIKIVFMHQNYCTMSFLHDRKEKVLTT